MAREQSATNSRLRTFDGGAFYNDGKEKHLNFARSATRTYFVVVQGGKLAVQARTRYSARSTSVASICGPPWHASPPWSTKPFNAASQTSGAH